VTKLLLGLLATLLLSGCVYTPPRDPIVDMTNVTDLKKFIADSQECRNAPLSWGNPVSRCMKKKGYKITTSYDAWE